jgi:hypothetical protein
MWASPAENSREEIHVSLEVWHGRRILNMLVYFKSKDSEWLPSRKGLAVSVDRVADLLVLPIRTMEAAPPTARPAA